MDNKNRRVVVTGVGAYTTFGNGSRELFNACLEGKTNVATLPPEWGYECAHSSPVYSPLPEPEYLDYFVKLDLHHFDKVALNAVITAHEALIDAGYHVNRKIRNYEVLNINLERLGVSFGTGMGGVSSIERHLSKFYYRQYERKTYLSDKFSDSLQYDPLVVPRQMSNSAAAAVGIKFNAKAAVQNTSLACSTGSSVIIQAYKNIMLDEADVVIAGASECLYDSGASFKGFDLANTLMSDDGEIDKMNKPFDVNSKGFLFSQGASGCLILESLEHAVNRNANIYAEIVGASETFDSYSIVQAEPTGAQLDVMLNNCTKKNNIHLKEIDYINAHGTGTKVNDSVESNFLFKNFKDYSPLINSTKSLIGHPLGASGAVEAIVTLLSMKNSIAHKNRNLNNPRCTELNFIKNTEEKKIETAYSHSLAFGGHNSSILFSTKYL